MAKRETLITPIGVARYPYLTKPDSTGKFADGKFKTKLVVSKKSAKDFIEKVKAEAKAAGVKKLPFMEDPDNEENIIISAKSKFAPLLSDGKKQRLKAKVDVGGGSKIRIGGILFPYETGISYQLTQVQVIELVEREDGDVVFDEVDGSFDASEYSSDDEPTFGSDERDASNELNI